MASVPPERYWTLLAESRLVDPAALDKLRRDFEGLPFPPGTSAGKAAEVIARWLVKRGAVSEWQAKRLLRGEKGPFFLGDYRLLDRFETGRGATVFRARHEPTGRLVGITALNNRFCQEPEVWSDILRRTKVATEAADPTLTRTWALERAGSQRFVLSEDVVGSPLGDELAKRGPLPVDEAGGIVLAVARAVAELHRRGVVHGGISLDSVRREAAGAGEGAGAGAGAIRLLQYPLVADPHRVPQRLELDSPEAVARLGTRAAFLAPEWLRAGRVCDAAGDVYSLGCLLHALLSGTPPGWQGDAASTLAHVAAGHGPPALSPGRVPVEVATLVSYLTARAPADRYPTAAEAADAVAACFGRPQVSPTLPPQAPMLTPGTGHGEREPEPDAGAAVALVDSTKPMAVRRKPARGRPRRLVPAVAGLVLLATSVIAAVIVTRQRTAPPAAPVVAGGDAAAAGREADDAAGGGDAATREPEPPPVETTLVDADAAGEIPWEAPLPPGPPPALRFLPPGSQLVLRARPAAALASEEGRLFLRSLGPRVSAALDEAAARAGVAVEGIEEIEVGWQAGVGGEVVAGYLVRAVDPLPAAASEASRAKALGPTTAEEFDGETLHRGGGFTAWYPSDAGERVVVVGPDELVRQSVEARDGGAADGGTAATLPPDLEALVSALDGDRHLVVFGSPDYLLHDGRPLLAGPLAKIVEPLAWFFGDSVRAAALSIQFGTDAYVELDAIAPAGVPAAQLARRLSGNVASLAERVEEYCAGLDPHPYGRKLVMRLPRMLGVVADQVRSGVEGRGVIVNAWLPGHAPHNIALASELALEQVPRPGGAAPAGPAAAPRRETGALAALARPMSLSFAKDTLERSIQLIAEEIGVEMEILGGDLQLEGITKNQSFALDERDKPAAAILRTILARANPDGKLVYVVREGASGERIEITTRAAAEKRGDTLPPGQDPPGGAGEGTPTESQETR